MGDKNTGGDHINRAAENACIYTIPYGCIVYVALVVWYCWPEVARQVFWHSWCHNTNLNYICISNCSIIYNVAVAAVHACRLA